MNEFVVVLGMEGSLLLCGVWWIYGWAGER